MAKRNFYQNPTEAFLSNVYEEAPSPEPIKEEEQTLAPEQTESKMKDANADNIVIPEGFKLVPFEAKSKRLQLLITPSLAVKVKEEATNKGISVNELINNILTDALRKEDAE